MDGLAHPFAIDAITKYIASIQPPPVAVAELQKVWRSPATDFAQDDVRSHGWRIRMLARVIGANGRLHDAKLWFYLDSLESCQQWNEQLSAGSYWLVFGRAVDVGNPNYSSIAVSNMRPLPLTLLSALIPVLQQADRDNAVQNYRQQSPAPRAGQTYLTFD